jgi:proteic killer suppression protein
MIRSFADRATRQLWATEKSKAYGQFARVALRKLMQLNAAEQLDDLKMPPGNRLEGLKGDRLGQYSIRINQQWRICFVWKEGGAYDVEIVDYH